MNGRDLSHLARRLELEERLLRAMHAYIPGGSELARPGSLWNSLRDAASDLGVELDSDLEMFLRTWARATQQVLAETHRTAYERVQASSRRRVSRG